MSRYIYNCFGISGSSSITKTENVTLDSSKSLDPNTPGNTEGDTCSFRHLTNLNAMFGHVKIIVNSYESCIGLIFQIIQITG